MLFPETIMVELANYKKVIISIYNSCSHQLGICRVIPTHAYKQCRFLEFPVEWPALLGMPDVETLEVLSVNYKTKESVQKSKPYQLADHTI